MEGHIARAIILVALIVSTLNDVNGEENKERKRSAANILQQLRKRQGSDHRTPISHTATRREPEEGGRIPVELDVLKTSDESAMVSMYEQLGTTGEEVPLETRRSSARRDQHQPQKKTTHEGGGYAHDDYRRDPGAAVRRNHERHNVHNKRVGAPSRTRETEEEGKIPEELDVLKLSDESVMVSMYEQLGTVGEEVPLETRGSDSKREGQTTDHHGEKRSPDRPHVVFFIADDMGFHDIGWHNPEVVSPNLDELARQGLILDRNYVAPVCTPTRGALMTGRFPFHTGMQHSVILPDGPECAPTDLPFLPQSLSSAGYTTHMLGKWHLGFCRWECTPLFRGFDTFYGFYNGYIDHYTHDISGGYDWWDGMEPALNNNGTYATDLITERAVELIHSQDPNTPMYMYVAYSAVHIPIEAPESEGHGSHPFRSEYLAMVTGLDESVGTIVQALRDTGLYDNTVIIFSSDNGGEFGPSSNFPLRGEKGSIYEGGTRVPAMVHSPLMTNTGTISEGLFSVVDWFPTIAGLANAPIPDGLDGVDQSGMLFEGAPSNRNMVVYNIDQYAPQPYGVAGILLGEYKLILGFPGLFDGWDQDGNLGFTHELDLLGVRDSSIRKRGDYDFDWEEIARYCEAASGNAMLFNVFTDPEERINLADEMPEQVELMETIIQDLYSQAADVDLEGGVPDSRADPAKFGGVWSPGWC